MVNLIEILKEQGADVEDILERFLGDEEFYTDCFREFMLDDNFEALGKAIEDQDYGHAFDCAHALKGVAGNLGLKPLYYAVSDIVSALRTQQFDDLGTLYWMVVFNHDSYLALLQ